MQARQAPSSCASRMSRRKDVAFLAKRTGSTIVVLAASVGALPEAPDYISMFDRNVAALLAATALR